MDDRVRRAALSVACLAASGALACASGRFAGLPEPRVDPLVSSEAAWVYVVEVGDRASELTVDVAFPPGINEQLSVGDGVERFVLDVARFTPDGWEAVEARGLAWRSPECAASGCRLRYRFALADAASAMRDPAVAALAASGDARAIVAPPATWLLHPWRPPADVRVLLTVRMAPNAIGTSFATGLFRGNDAGTHSFTAGDLDEPPFSIFGSFRARSVSVPQSTAVIELAIAPGALALRDEEIARWVSDAAAAASATYGRFPVRRVLVVILPVPGDKPGYARTLGNGGASIVAPLGQAVRADDLSRDWVMTHEMLHLGFPNLPRRHLWLEEGLATYVEPIARARLGLLTEEDLWRELHRGMQEGLPEPGDQGLDKTAAWGRTYWGGAIFCLLADVEIRTRTENRRSIDDVLRAILRQGGDISVRWEISRVIAEADRATGVPVFAELHARLGSKGGEVTLDRLFADLGVRVVDGRVFLDDSAPLAHVRRAIARVSGGR